MHGSHSRNNGLSHLSGVWFCTWWPKTKCPLIGRSGFPRGPPVMGTVSGSCPGLPSSLPASCLQGGNWGRSQALLKPRHSPSACLGHSGVQSHVITNVPVSSHTPGNRPWAWKGRWKQLVISKWEWRPWEGRMNHRSWGLCYKTQPHPVKKEALYTLR